MATVKELVVEIKKSRNFQTYTCGVVLSLEPAEGENEDKVEELTRYWQAKCRGKVNEQMKLDTK